MVNAVIIFLLVLVGVTYDISWTILVGVWLFASAFITKIMKRKAIVIQDPELGEIVSTSIDGWQVEWLVYLEILDAEMKVELSGNSKGISKEDRERVLIIKANEEIYASESQRVLGEAFQEADLTFSTVQDHFIPRSIELEDKETILTFEERKTGNYFNVFFFDGRATGYTIDT